MSDNKYLNGMVQAQAPSAEAVAAPAANKYASGALLTQPQEQPVDKYHQRAADWLDQQKALHGGRDLSGGALNTYLHGATAGIGNRAVAGLHAGIGHMMDAGGKMPFSERLAYENALEDEKYRRASEGAGGMIGEIAGAIVNPMNKIGGGGIGTGALIGGTTGAMDNRSADGAAVGAAAGGVGGAIGKVVGGAINLGANMASPGRAVPSLQAIQQAAQKHEDDFVNSGVQYTQDGAIALKRAIENTLEQGRYKPTTFPEIAGSDMLKEADRLVRNDPRPFQAFPDERSVMDIRDLSRIIQREQGSVRDPNAARLLSQVQQTVRDFPANATPSQVLAGDSVKAGTAWKDANSEYVKAFKTQALRDALETAADKAKISGSGGNIDNMQRRLVLNLKNSRSDWTPDELAQLDKVIGGTDDSLRAMGKASPQGNGLMQFLNWSSVLNNPKTAILPLLASGARKVTEKNQQLELDKLDKLFRAGGAGAGITTPTAAQKTAQSIAPRLSGPFAQLLYSSMARPAPVKGGR